MKTINNTYNSLYDHLHPDIIIRDVEHFLQTQLNGVITPYNSYVNRVYGIQDEEDNRFIVKYYRPGRWSLKAIQDEHQFLFDCAKAEIPVVTPIYGAIHPERNTNHQPVTISTSMVNAAPISDQSQLYFSLFPLKAGRTFDISQDEDWIRLGALIGRLHKTGSTKIAKHRIICSTELIQTYANYLVNLTVITPTYLNTFKSICRDAIKLIEPLFDSVKLQRIHGDCHRGNILDRPSEGLQLIDFDDMMTGPAVQDLWLLLPDHADAAYKEISLLLEGYTTFSFFHEKTLELIEPLRFIRIIYYLTWCAQQKDDFKFQQNYPEWGSDAFWLKEIEDLETQLTIIKKQKGSF